MGNGMRGMMGTRGIRVGTRGINEGMRGVGGGMLGMRGIGEIRVEMWGMGLGMWGIRVILCENLRVYCFG